jgi:hypothetical protein
MASTLAQSFIFSRTRFDRSYPALLAADHACLLVAVNGDDRLLGYEESAIYHRKILDSRAAR